MTGNKIDGLRPTGRYHPLIFARLLHASQLLTTLHIALKNALCKRKLDQKQKEEEVKALKTHKIARGDHRDPV